MTYPADRIRIGIYTATETLGIVEIDRVLSERMIREGLGLRLEKGPQPWPTGMQLMEAEPVDPVPPA